VKSKEVKTGLSNLIEKTGSIFYGSLWLKKGYVADDDDKIYYLPLIL
jgi:hypothetical protein